MSTWDRALSNAHIGARACGRSYVYRLVDGTYYNSDFAPGLINAAWAATVTHLHTGEIVVEGGPTP